MFSKNGSRTIGSIPYLLGTPVTFTKYKMNLPSLRLMNIWFFYLPSISGIIITFIIFFCPGSIHMFLDASLTSRVSVSVKMGLISKISVGWVFLIVMCFGTRMQRGVSLKSNTFGSISIKRFGFMSSIRS